MKFIRYGSLAPQSAVRWEIDRASMPVRRGIYAFPCGYLDYFYIWSGRGCDANPRVRYLKDESGRRLFYDELLDTPFQAGRTSIEYYNAYNELYDRIKAEEPDLTSIARNRKLHWRQFKPEWADYLKRTNHIKDLDDIKSEPRKSWMMVMGNPDRPPHLTHDPFDPNLTPEQVEAISLDRKLHFLKGEDGKRVFANDLILRNEWTLERYWGDFRPLSWNELRFKDFMSENSKRMVDSRFKRVVHKIYASMRDEEKEQLEYDALTQWLGSQGIRLEQLCPWPVYPEGRCNWAVIYAKPHQFEYSGCLWHHLREFVKRGEILRIVDNWCYTTIGAYEDALRKAGPMLFERSQASGDRRNVAWHGWLENTIYYNKHVPRAGYFEVFIDSKLVERKK